MDPNETELENVTTEAVDETPKPEATVEPKPETEPTSEDTESTDETPEDAEDTESNDETADEPDDDVLAQEYVDNLANSLREADAPRFEELTGKFTSGEKFTNEDVAWISEITGNDAATVRYGLSLQRDAFEAQRAAEKSVADAEAELGDLESLLDFARGSASPEQLSAWQDDAALAKRLGERASAFGDMDGVNAANLMTLNLLRDIKKFKDSIPGNRPKTLGHLAASRTSADAPTKDVQPAPVTVEPEVEPRLAAELAALANLSTQALAGICHSSKADPAFVSRAREILRERGVLPKA